MAVYMYIWQITVQNTARMTRGVVEKRLSQGAWSFPKISILYDFFLNLQNKMYGKKWGGRAGGRITR